MEKGVVPCPAGIDTYMHDGDTVIPRDGFSDTNYI